jgi:hypothetical protein
MLRCRFIVCFTKFDLRFVDLSILQNIAARNPVLSGEVRFLPLDELLESIMAVCVDHCGALRFYPTYAVSQPWSLICGASVERVPLVGEVIQLASCVSEIGEERDAVAPHVIPYSARG